MTRPIPTDWPCLPAAHLDLLSQHWADRDPAYATAAAAHAVVAALRDGTQQRWEDLVHDWWLAPQARALVRPERVSGLAALACLEAAAPRHECADPDGDGWRQALLLRTVDDGWLAVVAAGCDCWYLRAALTGSTLHTTGLVITVTPGPDLQTVLRRGLTEQDRAALDLPLPREQPALDNVVAA